MTLPPTGPFALTRHHQKQRLVVRVFLVKSLSLALTFSLLPPLSLTYLSAAAANSLQDTQPSTLEQEAELAQTEVKDREIGQPGAQEIAQDAAQESVAQEVSGLPLLPESAGRAEAPQAEDQTAAILLPPEQTTQARTEAVADEVISDASKDTSNAASKDAPLTENEKMASIHDFLRQQFQQSVESQEDSPSTSSLSPPAEATRGDSDDLEDSSKDSREDLDQSKNAQPPGPPPGTSTYPPVALLTPLQAAATPSQPAQNPPETELVPLTLAANLLPVTLRTPQDRDGHSSEDLAVGGSSRSPHSSWRRLSSPHLASTTATPTTDDLQPTNRNSAAHQWGAAYLDALRTTQAAASLHSLPPAMPRKKKKRRRRRPQPHRSSRITSSSPTGQTYAPGTPTTSLLRQPDPTTAAPLPPSAGLWLTTLLRPTEGIPLKATPEILLEPLAQRMAQLEIQSLLESVMNLERNIERDVAESAEKPRETARSAPENKTDVSLQQIALRLAQLAPQSSPSASQPADPVHPTAKGQPGAQQNLTNAPRQAAAASTRPTSTTQQQQQNQLQAPLFSFVEAFDAEQTVLDPLAVETQGIPLNQPHTPATWGQVSLAQHGTTWVWLDPAPPTSQDLQTLPEARRSIPLISEQTETGLRMLESSLKRSHLLAQNPSASNAELLAAASERDSQKPTGLVYGQLKAGWRLTWAGAEQRQPPIYLSSHYELLEDPAVDSGNEPATLSYPPQQDRFFIYRKVSPGAHQLMLISLTDPSQALAVSFPVTGNQKTYLDLTQITGLDLVGQVQKLNRLEPFQFLPSNRHYQVVVLGQPNAWAITQEEGRFEIPGVLIAGSYPLLLETRHPREFTHRYQIRSEAATARRELQLIRVPNPLIEFWRHPVLAHFGQDEDADSSIMSGSRTGEDALLEGGGGDMPLGTSARSSRDEEWSEQTGIVVGFVAGLMAAWDERYILPNIYSLFSSGGRESSRVSSTQQNLGNPSPKVFTLSPLGFPQFGLRLQEATHRFLGFNIPAGPTRVELRDENYELVFSELVITSPRVINIVGPY